MPCSRRPERGGSSTPRRVRRAGRCAAAPATEDDEPAVWELRVPYKRTKLAGERLALAAAARGATSSSSTRRRPSDPAICARRRPGRWSPTSPRGRARGYLAGSALNVVAVEDVARGHALALERGCAGRRYLLGGENLAMRDVFATICAAVGRPAPRLAVPWGAAYAAAWVAAPSAPRPVAARARRGPGRALADALRRRARAPRARATRRSRRRARSRARPGPRSSCPASAPSATNSSRAASSRKRSGWLCGPRRPTISMITTISVPTSRTPPTASTTAGAGITRMTKPARPVAASAR